MKSNLAWVGAAVLVLSGCVAYDDGYRTTGRVGDGYGTYNGQRVYDQSRTRIVEDRAGNIYRVYPDGTSVLISRGGYNNYPYGYGGYSSGYPYGYGGYNNTPAYGGYGAYGSYGSYPGGVYVGPPRVYPVPRPGHGYPTRPNPGQPLPNAGTPPSPPVVGSLPPPPVFTPRTEAAGAGAERAEARRESHKGRELRGTEP